MKVTFFIGIGCPAEHNRLLDKLSGFELLSSEELKVHSVDELGELLEVISGVDATIRSSTEIEASEVAGLDFFELRTKHRVSLSMAAWERNFAVLDEVAPNDKGGWCPVSVPHSLVYATRAKKIRDISYLMDGYAEFAVSTDFLQEVQSLDDQLYGEKLFANKTRTRVAEGVVQLATKQFSEPCVRTASVGVIRGLQREGYPGSENIHLGVPTLPSTMTGRQKYCMRSAEPWSGDLVPGWIVPSGLACEFATLSSDIVLAPILTAGSDLQVGYERQWQRIWKLTKNSRNLSWGAYRSDLDLSPVVKKSRFGC